MTDVLYRCSARLMPTLISASRLSPISITFFRGNRARRAQTNRSGPLRPDLTARELSRRCTDGRRRKYVGILPYLNLRDCGRCNASSHLAAQR